MEQEISANIADYVQKAGFEGSPRSVIPLLQYIQEKFSYIPEKAIDEISLWTKVSRSHIYGVITFYSQFRLIPLGRNVIRLCDGTACHINNSEQIYDELVSILNIKDGQTTEDGMFTLLTVACLGCCSLAPVIMINDRTYGRLTPKQLKKIIDSYYKQEEKEAGDKNEN